MKARLNAAPLFWKAFALLSGLLAFVVGAVELIGEPLAVMALGGRAGGFWFWEEAALWVFWIVFPSLACGWFLSRLLTGKLDRIAKASRAIARGNLDIRLPVAGNGNDAFDVLARSFNVMAETIKSQRQNERRLLADISHELRSPLTRISVAAEIIGRSRRGGEKAEEDETVFMARRLSKEVARMEKMIALLLETSRDRALAPGGNGPVDIGKTAEDLAEDFSFQGENSGRWVSVDKLGDLAVYGNGPRLERMLGNIIANGMFYGPEGGEVKVACRLMGGTVHVSVRDFGPGVPEGELEDIFHAFYRVDGSRARASGGVGLGLALARETAVQHGGNVVAENALPGLKVTVTLPAYSESRDA
ncbi:MAG: HAMP domain-containing protein [Deltaproteobacteria bacterium]|nr:HAMP domain-containing protein [Deltaproteobacteria bacterium]